MTMLQKHVYMKKLNDVINNYYSETSKIKKRHTRKRDYILGGYSRTLCNIVAGIVGHDNPTEEHCKNSTQVKKLQRRDHRDMLKPCNDQI